MALRLHNVGAGRGFSDGNISYLSSATVPGGDGSFQDSAPVGSFCTLTTNGDTYKKTTAGAGTAAWLLESLATVSNTANIATNTANIATNTANITTNTANITTNTVDIAAEVSRATAAEIVVQGNLDTFAATKGVANGLATLDANSQIPTAQIPAVAISTVSVVASEAAQIALTAQTGDVVVRSDLTQSSGNVFMHNGGVAGTVADWTQIDAGGFAVSSVNGQVGTIVITAADVGADVVGSAATVQGNLDTEVIRATAAETTNAADIAALQAQSNTSSTVTGVLSNTTVDTVAVTGTTRVEWILTATSTTTPGNAFSMNLSAFTDGTNVDHDEDGVLELGADINGFNVDVTLAGGNMILSATSSESVTVNVVRINV